MLAFSLFCSYFFFLSLFCNKRECCHILWYCQSCDLIANGKSIWMHKTIWRNKTIYKCVCAWVFRKANGDNAADHEWWKLWENLSICRKNNNGANFFCGARTGIISRKYHIFKAFSNEMPIQELNLEPSVHNFFKLSA